MEVVNAAFSSLRQLTSFILHPCIVPPASLTLLTNLRRLAVYFAEGSYGSYLEEAPEVGVLPPPGAWSSGLQKLGLAGPTAFRSLDTLRRLPALEHLRLYAIDVSNRPLLEWEGLLEAAAANQQLQRIVLVDVNEAALDKATAVDGSLLLRLQRTHPHLTICKASVVGGDGWLCWND